MTDTLIPLGLAQDWIARLWKKWSKIRTERHQELQGIEKDFANIPELEQLARLYIEPRCQHTNPADHDEDEPKRVVREAVHDWFNGFLEDGFQRDRFLVQDGRNTVFVLSDAGMGKSSLLMMLKLTHLSRVWPKGRQFKLMKLGPQTVDILDRLGDRGETVLMLDALDEDPSAWGRIEERLVELLGATKNFRQVILTCRTQFFPTNSQAAIEKPNKIEVGGYVCNLIYLSPFNDEQVEEYLRRAFPDGWQEWLGKLIAKRSEPEERGRARAAVRKMRSLRMRPMLLAYIQDLMYDEEGQWTEYWIFHKLVKSWLDREIRKGKGGVTSDELWATCTALAFHLQATGRRELALSELTEIYGTAPLAHLQAFEFGGRSLLNRTSEREFRFAHYSIQEFLVAHASLNEPGPKIVSRIHATDQIISFLLSWVGESPRERLAQVQWEIYDFSDLRVDVLGMFRSRQIDLRGAELRGIPLKGSDLRDFDLRGTDLRRADLREADLRGLDLSFGCFLQADLRGAKLEEAITVGTGFFGAKGVGRNLHGTAGPPDPREFRTVSQSGHAKAVTCVAWSQNGCLIASVSADKTIKIWNSETGHIVHTLMGHTEKVNSVAWDPSGMRLASGADDGTVRIWDTCSGLLLCQGEHEERVSAVAWDPGGERIASGSKDRTVKVWDPESGRVLNVLTGHRSWIRSVAWDSRNGRIASGADDGLIKVWDPGSALELQSLAGHEQMISSLAWNLEGHLASVSSDLELRIWDVERGSEITQHHGGDIGVNVLSMSWEASGDRIALGLSNGEVRILSIDSERRPQVLSGHKKVLSVAWEPNGERLASASDDKTVKIWDPASERLLRTLKGDQGWLIADGWAIYSPTEIPESLHPPLRVGANEALVE